MSIINSHENTLFLYLSNCVPVKLDHANFEAPHFKTFLLLQAHFSHPPDLTQNQILVLEKVLNLLSVTCKK